MKHIKNFKNIKNKKEQIKAELFQVFVMKVSHFQND